MNTIHVVVAVDVEGALSSGSLESNVYMVDSNKYLGSWQQGTSELHTVCQDGQTVAWACVPVDPATSAEIEGFAGTMVSSKVCQPQKNIILGDGVWGGQVETRGMVGSYPYTLTLTMNSHELSFDAFLKVV